MAYDTFTKEVVFTDHAVNTLCNLILELLILKFTLNTITSKFCLTGTVAKIIQNDPLIDVKTIAFITDDVDVYKYCSNELPKLLNATAITFKDRIQIKLKSHFFEIWLIQNIGTINTVTGIQVQDLANIPLKN